MIAHHTIDYADPVVYSERPDATAHEERIRAHAERFARLGLVPIAKDAPRYVCVDGHRFENATRAARWMRNNGFTTANSVSIRRAIAGGWLYHGRKVEAAQ